MPSFAALERADAHTAMRRIGYALDRTLDRLQISATDWGNWADTYQYVEDHNEVQSRPTSHRWPAAARRQRAADRRPTAGSWYRESSIWKPTTRSDSTSPLRRALPANFPWRANLRRGQPASGLLRTNRGVLMLAAAPVLDGNGSGPARGMVILGRLLSSPQIESLGAQAQAALVMMPPRPVHGPRAASPRATPTRASIAPSRTSTARPRDDAARRRAARRSPRAAAPR